MYLLGDRFFKLPLIVECLTTDCWTRISLNKEDAQFLAAWDREPESKSMTYSEIREVVKDQYPDLYWIDLVTLGYGGNIYGNGFFQLRPMEEGTA